MALKIRAVYQDGQIKLLDPVELQEGQTLMVTFEPASERESLKAILGDMVIWPDTSDDSDAWVEDMADEIAQAFSGLPSLSDIIIEERNSGW